MQRTLLIDDEAAARLRMGHLLEKYANDITIIGEAQNGTMAVEKINTLRPDLVFLDIQMPDFNGFEVLSQLTHTPKIVFTTAFLQYAVRAFDVHSLDYLVKPISEDRFAQTMLKVKSTTWQQSAPNFQQLRQLFEQLQPEKAPFALTVKKGDRIILLRFEEITHLQAEDKYVTIHTLGGEKYLSDLSLNQLSDKLSDQFVRVHRATIINQRLILEAKRFFKNRFILTLRDGKGTNIRSSATYYRAIREVLGV
ncbi:MAG: LytTR family DNA-binding domain-containing protein [Bacteroidota bacterium]